jgi:predicted naringenin-chalcone synthase
VLSVLFEDAMRQKAVAKIKDDNFIFIRRAIDV